VSGVTNAYEGNFMGTFDGDGHTIELDVQYNKSSGTHAELGLFRGASGATFKNLTLTGTIKADSSNSGTTGTNHIGAFVGRAHGNLTFENCTNDVDITARGFSVGGFVGSTKLTVSTTNKYTFIGCVNSGNITTYSPVGEITYNTYDKEGLFENPSLRSSEFYGVGGFIGTVWNGTVNVTYSDVIANDNIAKNTGKTAPTENENGGEPSYSISGKFATTPVVVMESCRNTGSILGSYNVGGLIGFNGGSTEIMNCGNTGTVEAIGEGTPTEKLNRRSRSYIIVDVEVWQETILGQTISREYNYKRVYVRRYLNAGGLVGLSSSAGHVDMYTSYNAGTIHAWGNNAGGLIAADTEYTKVRSSNPTNIFYCYNTGEVITGADMYTVFYGANKEEAERYDQYVNLNDVDEMKEKGRFLIKRTGSNNKVLVDNMPNDKAQQEVDHYEMSLRHEDKLQYENSTREGGAFGVQVGGIIGATTNTDIKYCYNVGTITCRGLATYTHRGSGVGGWTTYTEYHSRAGGIVGYVDGGLVSVQNSYSVGDIRIEARHAVTSAYGLENWISQLKAFQQQRPMYVAGIVGHHNSVSDLSSKVTNCYSLMWQCHYLSEENKWERYHIEGYNPVGNLVEDWKTNKLKFVMGNLLPVKDEHSSSGNVVRDISYLTAITNADGIVTMPSKLDDNGNIVKDSKGNPIADEYKAAHPLFLNITAETTENGVTYKPGNSGFIEQDATIYSATKLNHDNAGGQSDVRTLRDSYDMIKKAGTSEGYGGWIFMPGCLPQLAMFALDT
ncbi:MAG: hypothetical protein IKW16_00935, partial [Clostridia bacterium]|nr:hypothetical protein [Clostridia bacterium]